MLLLNLDIQEVINGRFLGTLGPFSGLGLLLTHASDVLKNVI